MSLPPFNFFFINFFTFSILFGFLFKKLDTRKEKKFFFFYGWFFGFGYFLTNLYWISISLTFDENFIFLTNLYRKFIHKKKIDPFLLSLSNEISDFNVTTNISDQMMNFSEKNKIKVYYYPIDFFFKKSPLEIKYANNNVRFIEEIVTLVNEIFIEFKCKLTKNLIIYIKKLLTNLDSYLTFFKNHILKKNRII